MLYSFIAFWSTYFVFGYFLNNHHESIVLPNNHVSMKDIYYSLIMNMFVSFIFIPITNLIPIILYLPDIWYYYIVRWILALLIGDAMLYISHRLLHFPFYRFHKQHHVYTNPHVLAGLYAHPIEYLFSNHLSMIIPMKLISNHNLIWLESAVIALNILISHSGKNNLDAKMHTLHHERNNCNYSFLYLMDIIFGTYITE